MNIKEYMRIHDYVRRHKNGNICEICGSKTKKLDNALISGKNHERNIDNYIKLCKKCHYHYDRPEGFRHSELSKEKIGLASKKRIELKGVSENFINAQKGVKQSQFTKDKRAESLRKEITHGTLTAYHKHKCRCDICKINYSNYQKKYRKNAK